MGRLLWIRTVDRCAAFPNEALKKSACPRADFAIHRTTLDTNFVGAFERCAYGRWRRIAAISASQVTFAAA
jgi:hypothetical protein